MTHEEALKDVENQLHDLMVSVDAMNVLMEQMLGQVHENLVTLVDEGYTVTVSPASDDDLYRIDCPAAYVVRIMKDTSVTSSIAEKLSDALAMAYENTRPIEEESK